MKKFQKTVHYIKSLIETITSLSVPEVKKCVASVCYLVTQSSSWVSIIVTLFKSINALLTFTRLNFELNYQKFCQVGNSRETELCSGARRMFGESRMCLQSIYYIYATKGEITGMIAPAIVILSIQVATVFAPERCDNLVWRASHYFQNMWSVSRLKDLVLKPFDFYTLFFVSKF